MYKLASAFVVCQFRDHPFKTSACSRGGGVSPCADRQKVDQKSPSYTFCWNGRGVGIKNRENLPTSSMDGPLA